MKYRTIVADPPWEMPSGGRHSGPGRWHRANPLQRVGDLPYKTMTVAEIKELPVPELSERDAHLYVWVPNTHLERVHDVVRAWGFRPSQMLVWVKTPRGIGLGGTFTNTTEFVLFARRGSQRSLARMDRTAWQWTRPHNNHSAKPDGFLDVVEQVSPGPYLELFARRQRLGWDTWGDEALEHVSLETA